MAVNVRHHARTITYAEFRHEACSKARTLSRLARPSVAEQAYTFTSTVGEFVAEPTYPVWFVSSPYGPRVGFNDPQAQPIRYAALLARPELVSSLLAGWPSPELAPPSNAELITLYCTSCERCIVLDGNHRLLWLAASGHASAPVLVTELAGSGWPPGTPDVNVICACVSGQRVGAVAC